MEKILVFVTTLVVCISARPQIPFGVNQISPNGFLGAECSRREVSPGRFRFVCDGVPRERLTIRKEHILWLQHNGQEPQIVDIEVPNYKIDELIKAGFTKTIFPGSTINVLLRKPETAAEAEVQPPETVSELPTVNLQYEDTGAKEITHYPNDKPYSRLTGPILPPLASRFEGRGRFNDLFIQRAQREASTANPNPLPEEENDEAFKYY